MEWEATSENFIKLLSEKVIESIDHIPGMTIEEKVQIADKVSANLAAWSDSQKVGA